MNEQNKPITKQTTNKPSIRDFLQSPEFQRQAMAALPANANYVRFARSALTATFSNPKLLECTQGSFLNCLMRLAQAGLEPDGRRAHLIPRRQKDGSTHCTLVVDYKGLAEAARRFGDVVSIHCDVVREGDDFDYRYGTGARLEHVPGRDRGPVWCAYAFVKLKDGTEEFDVMSSEEVEAVRRRSPAANDGPWVTDWNEMAKKTAFRRLSKMLILSPELIELVDHDDDTLTGFAHAKPAVATVATPRRSVHKQEIADTEQPTPTAADVPQMPQDSSEESEPPSDSGQESNEPINDLRQVEDRLKAAGFTADQLLKLLDRVGMRKGAKSLSDLPGDTLSIVLEDWHNCRDRLTHEK